MTATAPSETESLRAGRLMLVFAILSGSWLMAANHAQAPFVIDEHVSFWIADPNSPGTLWERSLDYAATPPASSLLHEAVLKLGGNRPAVFRAVSWSAFVLAIAVIYVAGTKLGGPQTGGLAACVLAWHPGILDIMRLARPYALSVLLGALGIWTAAQWASKPRNGWYGVLFAAVSAGLLWTHYLNLPLAVALFLTIVIPRLSLAPRPSQRPGEPGPSVWLLLLVAALGAAAAVPLLPAVIRMMEWAPFLNFLTEPPNVFTALGPVWMIALPAALVIAILIHRLFRNPQERSADKPPIAAAVFLSLVPEVVLVTAAYLFQPSLGEVRYRVAFAPACALLFALLLTRFARPTAGFLAAAAGLGLAWTWMGELPWNSPALTGQAAADWKDLAEKLNQTSAPEDPLFVQSGLIESRLVAVYYADPVFLDYVSCRLGRFYVEEPHPRYALPWSGISFRDTELIEFYQTKLHEARQESRTVWLAVGIDTDIGNATLDQFQALADRAGFTIESEHRTQTAVLISFRPEAE